MIQAPSVTSLRVSKLAANFVFFKWDDVGGNFYYVVERCLRYKGQEEFSGWIQQGYTDINEWFDDSINPDYEYKYRVTSTYNTFEPSVPTVSDTIIPFTQNAYNFSKMNSLTLSAKFIQEKFVKNNTSYVNFNTDVIMAGLMNENFVYYPEMSTVDASIKPMFLVDKERHEVQGDMTKVCNNKDRLMLSEIDDVLYLFERFQPVIKVSNDKGQNWVYYKAFNGRVGNPVSNVCTYQSNSTTFVLGYSEVFFGRPSRDLRWSDDTVRWSSQEYTFAKLGDEDQIGFPVEIFGSYIDLPAALNHRTEAMACSDTHLYVGGKNFITRASLTEPTFDDKGKRTWEHDADGNDKKFYITADPEHKVVLKKLDTLKGKLYALISGRVKDGKSDPTVPENVEPSIYDGVYVFDDEAGTWSRQFGETEEERTHISHEYTNMSTDGNEIFFDYHDYSIELLDDTVLPTTNPVVKEAKKYSLEPFFSSGKSIHEITFRKTNDEKFIQGPTRYHGETKFTWSRRSGTRAWINPQYKAVVVYPNRRYEYTIDEDKEITKEIWNKGDVTIKLDNVQFNNFTNYSNGILLYKSSGEIIGYHEFNYRARDEASIYWKPDLTLLIANLVEQEREEPDDDYIPTGLVQPDITPLIDKMAPESYIYDDGLFRSFASNYLEFLSSGEDSYYSKLKNLIRNKYPKEKDNFEYLYSEINKRNIYLDKEKRDAVVRFFETRSTDFYSTKGVEQSYKFLFKLLYNAEVDIEVESKQGMEYDIVISSDDVTEDIVGTTVYTPTGRANVTYIEREYKEGKLQWRITIHNLLGKFIAGQELKSELDPSFEGKILIGVRGKELSYSDIDYINRGRVLYTMKIKSEIPLARYKDDVIRFVHPVGFGFIGITLLTVIINSGLSLTHRETIISIMKALKWDSGLPTKMPELTYELNTDGEVVRDQYNNPVTKPHPNAGLDPLPFWPNYDKDEGAGASARRVDLSPTFDAGWLTYAFYKTLEGQRLKDRIGLPRDPLVATQIKVEE